MFFSVAWSNCKVPDVALLLLSCMEWLAYCGVLVVTSARPLIFPAVSVFDESDEVDGWITE